MATVTITNATLNSGTPVKLLQGAISYGWNNLTSANPANSAFGAVEGQHNGWENPIMNLVFHIPATAVSGCMTWALWNQFVKAQCVTTTKTYLAMTLGPSATAFTDYSDSTGNSGRTNIPVSVISYTVTMSPEDSDQAGHFLINAQIRVEA